MKAHLQCVNSKILPGAIASLALFILLGGSTSALAQTNTFPASGNVGIGTVSPSGTKLQVVHNTASEATILAEAGSSMSPAVEFKDAAATPNRWRIGSGWNTTTDGFFFIYDKRQSAARMIIDTSGNIGIGTATPAEFVHVRKDQNAATHLVVENTTAGASSQADLMVKNNLGHAAQFGLYSSTTTTFGALASGNAFAFTTSPAMVIMANNGSGIIKFATGGISERMRIDASGNLGIGTTTPLYSLDVNGGTNGFRAKAASTSSSDTIATFENSSGIQAIIRASGSVGIGTITPNKSSVSRALTINGSTDAIYELAIAEARVGTMYHNGSTLSITNNANGALTFGTNNSERVRIDASGNMGIGTTPNANYKLDVNGSLNVAGNIAAKYQDVAEWVHSSQQLSAGTVVVLDHTKSNQVIASSQAYDTRVAGVISLQPGITLGENGVGKVLVATTGRVKVRVDATAGPIQVGDLLVTSDKEGIAKKSEPLNLGGVQIHRPGTLIGKALEPLDKGTGEILVLLSLQ